MNRTEVAVNLLIEACHSGAKANGWWDEEKDLDDLVCLVHSEVSEGMEGLRKDLMDTHLPHRKMIEVEFADVIIRLADMSGGLNVPVGDAVGFLLAGGSQNYVGHIIDANRLGDAIDVIAADMHTHESNMVENPNPRPTALMNKMHKRIGNIATCAGSLEGMNKIAISNRIALAMITTFHAAVILHFDLGGAIIEKLAYNAERADHKPENRAKDDGKKF